MLTQQISEDIYIRQLRLGAAAPSSALETLFQDGGIAVSIHPEDGHVRPADQIQVLLQKRGVPHAVLGQTRRHEDNATFPCTLGQLCEDGRPDLASQRVVLVAAARDDSLDGVDEEVVVQEAGYVLGEEGFGLLEDGELACAGEAVEDDDLASCGCGWDVGAGVVSRHGVRIATSG